jgi:phosphoserine phosphatase
MSSQPQIIYIDIDDTLIRSFGSKRIPMTDMVELVPKLKAHGATLYCWSSGGAAYARSSAEELGIADCFIAFLPKPQLLIDDVAIGEWKLGQLHPNECRALTVPELLERARRA